MSSEIIVVLALGIIAIGFIIWVRKHDGSAEPPREDEKGGSKVQ